MEQICALETVVPTYVHLANCLLIVNSKAISSSYLTVVLCYVAFAF
jgi:hypothetical protein